jgi:hypothetical protein
MLRRVLLIPHFRATPLLFPIAPQHIAIDGVHFAPALLAFDRLATARARSERAAVACEKIAHTRIIIDAIGSE